MSWLSKILGLEPNGLVIVEPYWEASLPKNFPLFLESLEIISPDGAILYLESIDSPDDIRKYLEARKAQKITKIQKGTIFPIPEIFHMEITKENMKGLIELSSHHKSAPTHIHIYKDDKMLLQWYDALDDPIFISKEISEDKVKEFCKKLGVTYKECTDCKKSNFEKIYKRFFRAGHGTPLNPKLVSPQMKPLLNQLYDSIIHRPVDLESIKLSLINLLTFLTTPEGRTRDNLWMADLFLCLDDKWEIKGYDDLPEPFQDILGRMWGLHDTIEAPEIAKVFASTPEELLEQAKKLQLEAR